MLKKPSKGGKQPKFTDQGIFEIYDLCKTYTMKSVAEYKCIGMATVARYKKAVKDNPERFKDYMTKEEYAQLSYKRDVKEESKK
ncbi:hypothetical protein [Vibrio coralliilyticus]|uniref:hypothetical protein n=1 Tax=Vibrio coralliilyticus TaxID=190893 RepID=UPI0015610FD1|nr:hypothetical protein [Vibrio coralliilyticus]NRF16610.1 hypothetical protein [Vibrio coralliilyticus]